MLEQTGTNQIIFFNINNLKIILTLSTGELGRKFSLFDSHRCPVTYQNDPTRRCKHLES